MADIFDMLFGYGSGAVSPLPAPSGASSVPSPYNYSALGDLPSLPYPTPRTSPSLTAPEMLGPAPISTPTIWPYMGSGSLLEMPRMYAASGPSAMRSPTTKDLRIADARLPAEERRTATAAIDSAFPTYRPSFSENARAWMLDTTQMPASSGGTPALLQTAEIMAKSQDPETRRKGQAALAQMGVLPDPQMPATQSRPGLLAQILGGLGALGGQPQEPQQSPLAALLSGGQSITAPGGGGAYVAPSGSFIESVVGSGALVPAALNNDRWTSSSSDSSNPSWW